MERRTSANVTWLMVIGLSAVIIMGCDRTPEKPEEESPEQEQSIRGTAEETAEELAQKMRELYDKAKNAGESVPDDVMAWAKEDVKKIGAWSYQILTFADAEEEEILAELNRLGALRWQCFFVEQTGAGKKFYMKKPARSYIKLAGRAAKFVPMPGAGE